jgi:hypothetical protein
MRQLDISTNESATVNGTPDLYAVMSSGDHGQEGIVTVNDQPMVVVELAHLHGTDEFLQQLADESGIRIVIYKYTRPEIVREIEPAKRRN